MNNLQAVILAAGESSRFWPFNSDHKSLFKIMGKPIILYTIDGLINSGIEDIIVVQGPRKDVERELNNYPKYNKYVKYVIQSDPKGMGDGLIAAKELLMGQFLVILAGRIDCEDIVKKLNSQMNGSKNDVILVGSKTSTPASYGILKLENNRVIDIVEKPKPGDEPSNVKALGVYILTPAFFDVYKETSRHQYDFEDTLSLYMKKYEVRLMLWDKEASSLKYPWHLFNMRDYLFKKYLKKSVGKNAKIAGSAEIIGNVSVGDNVTIMEKAVIKGPCYIGNNVFIGNNAILRGGVNIEDNCAVGANMELKNSLIMDSSTTHSGFMGDSIVGRNCKIAAGFYNANVRLDRESIKAVVKGERVDTKLKSLGSLIGDNSNIGIKVSTMPGIIIGKNVVVGASTTVMSNIPDNTKYYTKFQEIVSKKNE